jgi:hypothetical protein
MFELYRGRIGDRAELAGGLLQKRYKNVGIC